MNNLTNRELYLLTECTEWQSCSHGGCKARREIERLMRELAMSDAGGKLALAERDRLKATLREAARQIRSDSGPCPVDMASRVGLLLTRIDLQLKDSSDETSDARLLTFSKYILQHCNYHRLRDHACPRCMPEGGDLVKTDFVCAYHQAKDYAEQHGWTDPRASGEPA